jgi:nucleotide-binding universal stress UspA family protein
MLPIRTILHPTDFSDRSQNALHLAAALARDYGARLVVLHVMSRRAVAFGEGVIPPDPAEDRRETQDQLDRLVVPGGDPAADRRLMESEDPAGVIVRVARELPADLVVLGTHGRTGLARVVLGSVAEQVLRRAPCPVLSVTAPFPSPAPSLAGAEALAAAGPM